MGFGRGSKKPRALGSRGQVLLGIGGEPGRGANGGALANIYRLNDPVLAELPLGRLMDEQLTGVREILMWRRIDYSDRSRELDLVKGLTS
jgi:hypothetical protein